MPGLMNEAPLVAEPTYWFDLFGAWVALSSFASNAWAAVVDFFWLDSSSVKTFISSPSIIIFTFAWYLLLSILVIDPIKRAIHLKFVQWREGRDMRLKNE